MIPKVQYLTLQIAVGNSVHIIDQPFDNALRQDQSMLVRLHSLGPRPLIAQDSVRRP